MGVHGLWRLLEAAGKPVPLETLENKVLAVDVSIWLHQLMKGFQDSRGAPLPNAHLLGLFHRVCKLLFYRIKPVFVFDGGVPLLKRQTIAARKNLKKKASDSAAEAKQKLLKNLVKRKAVRQILDSAAVIPETPSPVGASSDDMFYLPPNAISEDNSNSEDESYCRIESLMESSSSDESEPERKLNVKQYDLHTLDVSSEEFCSLPPDVRHDILSELKETRKQNSWGRLHEMPEESGEFSSFQLGRLLKRRNVQVSLEKAEKEMGGKVMRINELQELMAAQGVKIVEENALMESTSHRIASDSSTRYLLCKDPAPEAQSTSSSSTLEQEVKSNVLYEEQTEFISQMADNMMQQLSKKKQELQDGKICKETVEEKPFETVLGITKSIDNKVLADSWSSDEDIMISERENCTSTSKLDIKENTTEVRHLTSEKEHFVKQSVPTSENSMCVSPFATKSQNIELNLVSPIEGEQRSATSDISPVKDPNEELKVSDKSFLSDLVQAISKPRHAESSLSPISDVNVGDKEKRKANHQRNENLLESDAKSNIEENKTIEILIHPGENFDGDDLFADIFQTAEQTKPPNLQSGEESRVNAANFAEVRPFSTEKISKDTLVLSSDSRDEEDQAIEQLISEEDSPEENSVAEEATGKEPSLMTDFPLSSSELNDFEAALQDEQLDLQKEKGRQERLAASITDQMCVEAQELLQLFGLPFIVAPMEAEAQCAFLDAISMTEGSITDDSDIWLFGGRKVYKNFFNQKKHVLQFTLSNINHYYKISREQLVQLALLVGSDYTTGIQGIGPVTALEIIAAFQSRSSADPVQSSVNGLSQFRDWWNSGRPHKSNRMRQLDKKLKNIKLSEGFPSQAVIEAYFRPSVEDSQETFSWGSLDLPALREYARSKFGWTISKTDEILLPVAKRWSDRTSQRTIDAYFNFQPQLVEGLGKMSKRVQNAVTLMEADSDEVDDPDPMPDSSFQRKKDSKKRLKTSNNQPRKRQRCKGVESSGSEPDDDEQHMKSAKAKILNEERELPVRAPTVPRARSSTGVRRVGVKSARNVKIDTIRETVPVTECNKQVITSNLPENTQKKSNQKRTSKSSANGKKGGSDNSTQRQDVMLGTNISMPKCQPSVCGSTSYSTALHLPAVSGGSGDVDDDFEAGNVSSEVTPSSEVAAISEVNWDDDPWLDDQPSTSKGQRHRPAKLFFGGVRPNKPRKPVRRAPLNEMGGTDGRGMQPGWLTRERLQSRSTAWVDSVHTKKEEAIPQRERDQRALEEAKMKAISVVKASEARQASRLLGRSLPKRGRGRAKPTRKVLPEHNLSESSSDE